MSKVANWPLWTIEQIFAGSDDIAPARRLAAQLGLLSTFCSLRRPFRPLAAKSKVAGTRRVPWLYPTARDFAARVAPANGSSLRRAQTGHRQMLGV
jgi:hypothetical protein